MHRTSRASPTRYAMSDNYHQAVNGGTGANHIMLGHGDAFISATATAIRPSRRRTPRYRSPGRPKPRASSTRSRTRIPPPGPTTGIREDGYGELQLGYPPPYGPPVSGGGSYTNCADPRQPGVAPIVDYLGRLPRPSTRTASRDTTTCSTTTTPAISATAQRLHRPESGQHAVHHSALRRCRASVTPDPSNVSWKYYGDQWNNYVADPYQLNYGATGPLPMSTATSATRSSTTPRS